MLEAVVRRPPAARRRRCARCCGGLQSSGPGQRRLALTAVGTERSTAAQISSGFFFFFTGLTLPKVDICKYAVRIGNSSRLRGWRGVPRGAENVLRTEESTLEKQVSCGAEDSYFPRCSGFGVQVIIRLQTSGVLSGVPACVRLLHGWCWSSGVGFNSPLIPYVYPAGMKLCNTWVLSCQHQLQILARREADRSL